MISEFCCCLHKISCWHKCIILCKLKKYYLLVSFFKAEVLPLAFSFSFSALYFAGCLLILLLFLYCLYSFFSVMILSAAVCAANVSEISLRKNKNMMSCRGQTRSPAVVVAAQRLCPGEDFSYFQHKHVVVLKSDSSRGGRCCAREPAGWV